MLLIILDRVPDKTLGRHILLIRFPCTPAGFDEVWQAGRIHKTISTIGFDAKGIASHQGNIVRQAGMPNRVILGEQCIFTGKLVVVGHERIPDDRTKFLILEHDDHDMFKIGNKRLWHGC